VVDDTPPEWLDDDEQRAWRTYLFAAQRVDAALDRQLQRDAGMGHTQYAILTVLVDAGIDGLRMSELAHQLRFSPSRLAHAVSGLERSGWVERHECRTDRRGQIATVTPAGAAAQRDAAPGHVALVRELFFDHLEPDQVRQLTVLFDGIGRRATLASDAAAQPAGGPSPNS
jgi:DNA-binding MarR family transcriptional regulator